MRLRGAGVDVYEGKSNGQVVFEAHMVSPHQGVASPLKGRRGSLYEEQAFLLVSSYFYFYSKGMQ